MKVNPKFRNVLCPWQTPRELKVQQRFLESMLRKLSLPPEQERALLLLDRPTPFFLEVTK